MGVGKSTFAFTNTAITLDGGSTTINITRDNQSYSHKLSHGYGNIATLAVGTTSYTWKPTAAQLTKFFQEVPNQKTRQIDVYLDTYNGSTLVGRDVHAVTVTLSEATGKPTLSNFTINDGNATTKGWGILVYGKSTITASQSVSAKHGASIVKTVYTYEGSEYTSIASLIGSLPLTTTPTNYTIGCKTVDSRGFTTTASLTKSCAKYEAPTINSFEVIRCDTDGYESDNGTKAKAIVKGSWAYIGGKNAATFKIGYKLKSAESYTYLTISVANGTIDYNTLLSPTFVADSDYLFAVSLTDSISGSFSDSGIDFSNGLNILSVSSDNSVIDINSDSVLNLNAVDQINLGAHGIHFRTSEGTMFFESAVASEESTYGSIVFKGPSVHEAIHFTNAMVTQDIPVLISYNCNNLIKTGKYYLGNGSTNRPVDANGWLESKLYSTDYCHQVYTTYQGQTYERMMQAGTWGSWRGPLFTDFVVAQGKSGNWNYIKFANGLALCAGVWTFTNAAITTAWGALYKDNGTTVPVKAYPFTFTSVPTETANTQGIGNSLMLVGTTANTTKQTMGYMVVRTDAKTVSGTAMISVIGRWK